MFKIPDEYTRETLSVAVRSKMSANDVLDALHPFSQNTENLSPYPLTMVQSLFQHSFENGLKELALNYYTYIQVVRGKTGIMTSSTAL